MELEIKWTDFSKKELKNIFEYHKDIASLTIARKLVSGIAKETLKLKKQPLIGQEEDLLQSDSREFRYLVYKNYKIIYLVKLQENLIEIYDVFDTRQNPIKMKRNTLF
jgi:plasmid stabilization system protein ParE